jgi:cytochrome c biogenesis factor
MLVFALGMVSYFFYLRRRRRLPLFKLEVDRSTLSSKSSFVGFWALIFIALVCLVGLAFPNFSYNYWTFPFVIVFIVALIGCSLGEKTRLARLFLVATFFFGFGIFLVLLNVLAINILAVLSLPLLILAFATAFRKLIQVIRQRSARLLGRTILHFGIIVLLIGVFISAGAKDTSTITDVKFNEQVEALQTKLQITNFTANNSMSTVYNEQLDAIVPEYSYVKFDIIAQYLGKTYQGSLWAGFYPNYGLVLRPLIITTETGDIYMHLEYTNSLYDVLVQTLAGNATIPENIAVTVQTSPLVYLVWAGIALMVIGISFQTVANSIPKTGKPSNKKLSINPR